MADTTFETREKAAAAWLRSAKARGLVTVLGGGWWRIGGWNRPVQGLSALAGLLQKRARLTDTPDGRWKLVGF